MSEIPTTERKFKATGIYPFDPNVFTTEDFLAADLSEEKQCTDDDNDDPDSRRVYNS